ncbi:MAG: hypothetical protein U0736_18300 [Gemmataceae bacterium]
MAVPIPDGVNEQTARRRADRDHGTLGCSGGVCKPARLGVRQRGTGGVGSMVVQMAKAVSAGDRHRRQARTRPTCAAAGADGVLNYRTEDVSAGVRRLTADRGVDCGTRRREPDLVRTVELMGRLERIVLIAGR